ncbi:c-type cytochrome biogenesis protein CcmI [Leminorella grimontii]|uniref:c-type cytochrome biogenesis protein CcmI n=1 Tax=Leminorella grimontii TaxID=82981 RepID=UPI00321F8564
MTSLILTIVLALLIGVFAFVWPLYRRSEKAQSSLARDELNKRFYQQRLDELAREEGQGLVADAAPMVEELQFNLLEDVPQKEKKAGPSSSSANHRLMLALPGVALLLAVSIGVYWLNGSYQKVDEWRQGVNQLPALRQTLIESGVESMDRQQLATLAVGLRSELAEHPERVDDWVMLGRLGLYMRDMTTGIEAFAEASRRAPGNVDIQLGYAELLVRSEERNDNILASEVLVGVLNKDGDNIQALSLFGYNAYELQDYGQAVRAWKRLLHLLPPNDKRIAAIEESIRLAQSGGKARP